MKKVYLDVSGTTPTNVADVIEEQLQRQHVDDLQTTVPFLVEKVTVIQNVWPGARYTEIVVRDFHYEFCITFR